MVGAHIVRAIQPAAVSKPAKSCNFSTFLLYADVKELRTTVSFYGVRMPENRVGSYCAMALPVHLFRVVGLTGLEPVTLRLSSACSNQLSYRPGISLPCGNQWRHGDSNPRPIACKATALPTELYPLTFTAGEALFSSRGLVLRVFPVFPHVSPQAKTEWCVTVSSDLGQPAFRLVTYRTGVAPIERSTYVRQPDFATDKLPGLWRH